MRPTLNTMKYPGILILSVQIVFGSLAFSQNAVVPWSSFSGGVGIAASLNTAVSSAAGESFAGLSLNGNTALGSGFFSGLAGQAFVTSVENETALPAAFQLYQNYPNPFNPSTTIRYDLASSSRVTIAIYNMLGQRVSLLVNEEKSPGRYSTVWYGRTDDGIQVASGVYFYRIQAQSTGSEKRDFVVTKKLILLK